MIKGGKILEILQPVLAIAFGLFLGLLISAMAGENPWKVLTILVGGSLGSRYDLGMTLFYATPLIFTGLSVAVAFHVGLFNIGAEGQLTMGALAAACVGVLFAKIPSGIAPVLAVVAAFFTGALWGAIPGWLRARRGGHEVINTIMMNFIAAGFSSWVTLYLFKNPDSQNPETKAISAAYVIYQFKFFDDAPVSLATPFAVFVAIAVTYFLWKTAWGYEMRAVGQGERAAQANGIDSAKNRILAMFLAGGLAGLVGMGEVLGNAHRFKMGFSPGYGFIGIAVALLARNRPVGIIAAALLFAALHKGSMELDLDTEKITKDMSQILQALIIACVAAEGFWEWVKKRHKRGASS